MGSLEIRMFDIVGRRSERKKWISQFEGVPVVLFVVDLVGYYQRLHEESQTRMMESLVLFDSVVNSQWFMHSSIILCLNNVEHFRQKLAQYPLCDYFLDYSGGNDVSRAAKYILWRFIQLNRGHLSMYTHLTDPLDSSNLHVLLTFVKEAIMEQTPRACGLLNPVPNRKGKVRNDKESSKEEGNGEEAPSEIGVAI